MRTGGKYGSMSSGMSRAQEIAVERDAMIGTSSKVKPEREVPEFVVGQQVAAYLGQDTSPTWFGVVKRRRDRPPGWDVLVQRKADGAPLQKPYLSAFNVYGDYIAIRGAVQRDLHLRAISENS